MKFINVLISTFKENKIKILCSIFILIFLFSNTYTDGKDYEYYNYETGFENYYENTKEERYNLKEAKNKIDSIEAIIKKYKAFNNSENGSEIKMFNFSLKQMPFVFDIDYRKDQENLNSYFGISGFKIKPNRNFIAYKDSNIIYHNINNIKQKNIIKYRYHHAERTIFIPIKQKYTLIANIIFSIIGVITLLVGISFYFYPVRVLSKISMGYAFENKNYYYLTLIANIGIIYSISAYLLHIIIYLFLHNNIKSHFSFQFIDNLEPYKYVLLLSIVFYILANAFKKGTKMQEEQEYTV